MAVELSVGLVAQDAALLRRLGCVNGDRGGVPRVECDGPVFGDLDLGQDDLAQLVAVAGFVDGGVVQLVDAFLDFGGSVVGICVADESVAPQMVGRAGTRLPSLSYVLRVIRCTGPWTTRLSVVCTAVLPSAVVAVT